LFKVILYSTITIDKDYHVMYSGFNVELILTSFTHLLYKLKSKGGNLHG